MRENRSKLVIRSVAWVAAGLMPAMASAALTISLSNGTTGNVISPAANQQLNIISTASGSDATAGITGLDIYLQMDDGGTDNGNATNPVVPLFTNLTLTSGVFNGENGGNIGYGLSPDGMLIEDSIAAPKNTVVQVVPNAVLGVLTLNATGVAPGTYDVYFGNVGVNAAGYFDEDSDYVDANGNPQVYSGPYGDALNYPADVITVAGLVPEPSVGMLGMAVGAAALLGRRRRAGTSVA
jgi:hypothetical protein